MFDWLYYFLFGDGTADLAVISVGAGILAAGAAGALAKGVGSIFGSTASKKANSTNLQIARETNETNLRLAREQNDWNLAQWNRENNYNLPVNQMTRFRQAGINPYMAMNQLTNGNAETGLSSANLANQTPATVQPETSSVPQAIFEGIGDLSQSYIDSLMAETAIKESVSRSNLNDVTTTGKGIENYYSDEYYQGRNAAQALMNDINRDNFKVQKKLNEFYGSDEHVANVRSMSNLGVTQLENVVNLQGSQLQLNMWQEELLKTQSAIAKGELKWQDAKNAVGISLQLEQIARWKQQNAIDWYNATTNRMNAETDRYVKYHGVLQGYMQIVINEKTGDALIKLNEAQTEELAAKTAHEWIKAGMSSLDFIMKQKITSMFVDNFPQIQRIEKGELDRLENYYRNVGADGAKVYSWMDFLSRLGAKKLAGSASSAGSILGSAVKFVPK